MSFRNEQRGQDLVEYALLVSVVALASVVALGTFRDAIISVWNAIATRLSS
jgi:Flp pilus assembly pilin Flp